MRDISAFTNNYLAVSKFLGYQGVRTKSWYYTASFYDAAETFIASEVAFQYRIVRIPERAKYLRVTITEDSLEKANSCELTAQFFKVPVNCAFKKIRFERCRAVGLAQSAMRNMLVEDCEFTASGESLATCAYDAEDGWDMMQDVYIHRNTFFDNPRNEFLTCAGHNFIVEDNDCSIHLWGRTISPCVRGNRFTTANFYCDSRVRTMHGRYTDNTYAKSLDIGTSAMESDWTIVVSADLGSADQRFRLTVAQHGVLRNSTVANADVGSTVDSALGLIESSRFTDCKLNLFQTPFTIRDSSFIRCSIGNLNRTNRFERCSFTDTGLCPVVLSDTTILESAFTNTPIVPNWWSKPSKLTMKKCSVKMNDKSFISTPVYSIDQFLIEDCAFDCGGKSPVTLCDLRQNGHSDPDKIYENRPATLTLARCTVASANAPLISVDRGQKDSEKPLAIAAAGNKAADGSPVAIINNEDIHTTWKVTASAAE